MSNNSKTRMSVLMPIFMLIYLGVMAYMGRGHLFAGEYFFYFGIIGVGLIIIALLAFVLRKKEQMRKKREDEALYVTYSDDEPNAEKAKEDMTE